MTGVMAECPDCGVRETLVLGPTVNLSMDLSVEVESVRCSKCGYEGPPAGAE